MFGYVRPALAQLSETDQQAYGVPTAGCAMSWADAMGFGAG